MKAVFDQQTIEQETVRRGVGRRPPLPPGGVDGSGPLVWSNQTVFFNGHDGGGAAMLRMMTDRFKTANGAETASLVAELPLDGLDDPFDTRVQVLCVRADAMGAKVAMRVVSAQSRLVVVVASLDGIFHPKVPHAARFTFRHLETLCPVRFMPFETRWRSDLRSPPSRRYQQAIAELSTVIEETRNNAAGVHSHAV